MYSILLAFLLSGSPEPVEFLVITAGNTPVTSLTRLQLRQLYLKKLDRVRGVRLTPVQLKNTAPLKDAFHAFLFSRGFDLENYWLEQGLVGGEKPPIKVPNEAYMLAYVERNPGFVGYVNVALRSQLSNFGVKILVITD